MVRAAGFEPATTAVRVRGSGRSELRPVKIAHRPPSRIRTCGLRLRKPALCSAELRVEDWGCRRDLNPRLRCEGPESFPLDDGSVTHVPAKLAPGLDPGVGSGSPTRTCANEWLPSQESNLSQLCRSGSRVRLARLRGMTF